MFQKYMQQCKFPNLFTESAIIGKCYHRPFTSVEHLYSYGVCWPNPTLPPKDKDEPMSPCSGSLIIFSWYPLWHYNHKSLWYLIRDDMTGRKRSRMPEMSSSPTKHFGFRIHFENGRLFLVINCLHGKNGWVLLIVYK